MTKKKFLNISLVALYILFIGHAILLGGVFSSWLTLEYRSLYKLVIVTAPFGIYLIIRKVNSIKLIDNFALFIFQGLWLVLTIFFGKSLTNSLIIEPPIVLLLSLIYYTYLLLPNKTHKKQLISVIWLLTICLAYILIKFNIPLLGE